MDIKCLGSEFIQGMQDKINIRIRTSYAVFWRMALSRFSALMKGTPALLSLIHASDSFRQSKKSIRGGIYVQDRNRKDEKGENKKNKHMQTPAKDLTRDSGMSPFS